LSSSEQGAKKSLLFYYLYGQMVGGGCVLSQWVPFRVRSRAVGLLSWFIVPGVYFQLCSVVLHEANRSSVVFTFVLQRVSANNPTLPNATHFRGWPRESCLSHTGFEYCFTDGYLNGFVVFPGPSRQISDHAVLIPSVTVIY